MSEVNKRSLKVLLVTSDNGFSGSAKKLLEKTNNYRCRTEWKKSVRTALKVIKKGDFDVCFIDETFEKDFDISFPQEIISKIILLVDEKDKDFYPKATPERELYCLHKDNLDASTIEQAIDDVVRRSENFISQEDNNVEFRPLIENLPMMVFVAEPNPPYTPVYLSPAFESLGYPLEDWKNSDFWLSLIHPADYQRVLEEIRTATESEGSVDLEYRLIAKNGEVRSVRDQGHFKRDEKGNLLCWEGCILDTTELKHSENKLLALFQAMTDVILVLDENGQYLEIAPTTTSLLYRPSDELLGKSLHDTFPAEKADEFLNHVRAALKSGQTQNFEYTLSIGGQDLWFIGTTTPMTAGSVILVARDITTRKRAEEELKESEKRYRNLYENANDLIYVHDLSGNFLSCNSATQRVMGYTLGEALSMNIKQVLAPEYVEYSFQMLKEKLDGKSQTIYEVECITKDNRRVTIEINSSVIFKDGAPIAVQGIARDVTERKANERLIQQSETQMHAVFSAMTDIVMVFDSEGRYLKIAHNISNSAYKPAIDLSGRKLQEIFPESIADYFLKSIRQSLESKQVVKIEYSLPNNDDEYWYAATISPMTEDSIVMVARNISESKKAEKALKESEEQYRELFENANDLIFTRDLEGNFTSLNRVGERLTGYNREEVLQGNLFHALTPEYYEKSKKMAARLLDGESLSSYEVVVRSKEGQRIPLELNMRLVKRNGQPIGFQGIARDITGRKRAEQALIASEQRYRLLGEGIMHQIWTTYPDGTLNYVNRRILEFFGTTAEIFLQNGWLNVIHPEDLVSCIEKWAHSLATGADYIVEYRLRRHDGKYFWFQGRATAGRDAEGNVISWFGTNTDIDDRKKAEAKLTYFAGHDTLTNLPNRTKFMHHLERAVQRSDHNPAFRFGVLFLDLDRFKIINDSLGHSVGDKLLVEIAERLEECVRPNDIVARLGGDEFTVLLTRIKDPSDAVRVANRFLEKLALPLKIDNYEVFTSASIGIIVSDDVKRQPEDFLRDADTAMYRAKAAGKSRYEIFDRQMHIRNMNLLQMENDLRRAIDRNEFRVFYQPIVDLNSGEILEFEALIRWQHPTLGLVPPNDFIGIAEETGLIIPIGSWILEEACRQTVEWQARFSQYRQLGISVNLSTKQLLHPNIIAQTKDILERTKLKPGYLKLEVTESMVMENGDKSQAVISEFHALGTSISTDDFGTGYSSLSYLHLYPFNRLKIDRSFVGKMEKDMKSEAIVRTILMLGRNLEIETVAEGIENENQLWQLRSLGCRLGQGYFFSKPVDAQSAEKILEEGLKIDMSSMEKPFNSLTLNDKDFFELEDVY